MEEAMQCTEESEVKEPGCDDRDTSPQPPRIVESWSTLDSGMEKGSKVITEENERQAGSSSEVNEERATAGRSSTAIGVPPEYMRSAFHVDDEFREDVSKRYSELGMEIPERDIKCKQHWKNRRSVARAKKQRKRKEKLANATEEERQAMWEEKQESKRIRNKWVKESIDEIAWEPPHVVIDLSYEYDQVGMCFKELRSLVSQVTFAYGALKRAARPMPVHLTSMSSAAGSLIKATEGSASWKFFLHEERYTEVFKDQLENVLYLSPEAEEVLWTVEPDKIYIIGGIVDRNRLKGTSLNQATIDGVRTVRLPIQEVLKRPLGNSLNVNHVLDLLLRVRETGDWATVLEEVVPTRKGMRPQGQPGKRQRRLENKAKSSSSGDEASTTAGGDSEEDSGGAAEVSSDTASSSGVDGGDADQ